MITQKQVNSISPYVLNDSVVDELSAINEVEGVEGLYTIDDGLLDEVINSRGDRQ